MAEFLMGLTMVALAALVVFGPLVLSLVALSRTGRLTALEQRLGRLEAILQHLGEAQAQATASQPIAPVAAAVPESTTSEQVATAVQWEAEEQGPVPARGPAIPDWMRKWFPYRGPIDWEWLIGRRALGWVAVVMMVFAAAFFLRYAIQNQWIGPLGRVGLTAAAGIALALAGHRYDRRGWRIFAPMLTGAGVVVLYLATYAAFGFYHLLPRQAASLFLVVIVVESMVLAILYDRMALGLVAVIGGLITPVLLPSEHDQYQALFTYLIVLDASVVVLALLRDWPAIATTALLGTHALFWSWFNWNYHPEKRAAALGFIATVFGLFLVHALIGPFARRKPARWEDLGRWLANGFLAFLAVYVMLRPDKAAWLGTLAVATAAFYAALARLMLATRQEDDRLFLTTLALSMGFVAAAFPIQADAPWIAVGWAVEASVLWWLGLRVQSPALKALATALAAMAVGRLLFVDTMNRSHQLGLPVFNRYALPAIGVCACLLGALATTRRAQARLSAVERKLLIATEVGGVVLLGLVLSVDLYGYCDDRAASGGTAGAWWERTGQVTLSVLWAVYATAVLAIGFLRDRVWLRWTALAWYGVTVLKVFLVDLSGLDELYRILAFLAMAIALGLAAWAYQGMRPGRAKLALAGGKQ